MEFWLINPRETFQFPVPFEGFEVTFGSMTKTINVMNFGELSFPGNNKLREWSVSGFFPSKDYDFLQCTRKSNPYDYCKILDSIKYYKFACRFIATGTRLNNSCTIEEFKYGEKDGSGDVYFNINFKEHKVVGQKRVVVI
ncbi:terminase [Clostridium niameyense]|uniref:Terminase n=1 Tax=Clostridium niameyense TaxID=1622073 RepID=A0A6M0RDN2_9CLOT|nr:terminase [Clostridium niameyense]NEZ47957.1 terminase [Clostridium niameyense]